MEFGRDRVLVVEAAAVSREHLTQILRDGEYQVTAELAATLNSVLAFVPEGPSTSRAGLYTARGVAS
jgi:CheY-like chemotaxis protein